MLTTRTVLALAVGTVAWYLHPRYLPWPAAGTHALLDLIALRNPGVYLLFRAWWFLAPLATGSVLAAAAMSAWSIWGPSRRRAAPRGALPKDPYRADSGELRLTLGELHHPTEPMEAQRPSWLTIPERGLFTGLAIVGAVGSGKTSACMHPFAEQLFRWQASNPERRCAGLVLEVKGDFCFAVRDMLEACGRGGDYRELSLDGEWSWNPLDDPELDSYSLAYSIASLLNQLFGKGKEPFWQQAYTNLLRFSIDLFRLDDEPWVTLQDVYRMAISETEFEERLQAAGRRIPAAWAAPGCEGRPRERARVEAEELAAHLDDLVRWEWTEADGSYETALGEGDFEALRGIVGRPPTRIVPAAALLLTDAGREARKERRQEWEAIDRWFRNDWMKLDSKLQTSIVEGVSSFLSLFDMPSVAKVFCPPPGAGGSTRRNLPPLQELVESGGVLALNMPAGANPALSRAVGVMLKQSWLQALLRRPQAMADPDNAGAYWRPAVFLCDEYQSFATVGESDPAGDERAFALSRQSRVVPIVATQSISSLRSATGERESWRALFQTLRTKIFLSLSDEFSAAEASKLCGQMEVLKPNYSYSESAGRAGISLLTGRPGGSRGSLSASKSYSSRLEARFKTRDFAELDNAQAIAIPFDGVRTLPATRVYLKPHYLPRDTGYWRLREQGLL